MSHRKWLEMNLTSFILNTASSALSNIIANMVNNQTKAELERQVSQLVTEEIKKYHLRTQNEEVKNTTAEILNEVKRLSSITSEQKSTNPKSKSQFNEPITATYAQCRTYTRIDLIKSQVRIALRRTTDLNDYTIENYILSEIAYQNISEVNVYGLDFYNLCQAQLVIKIDWDLYQVNMANGKATVVITEDGRTWIDNTAIELSEAISLFMDYARANSLFTKCHTSYAPGVDWRHANSVLGMGNADPIEWGGRADITLPFFSIPEIDEVRVGFYCVG